MKGISAVIATLLMLVITVAIAITAYGYVSGFFETTTTQSIDFVDASCSALNSEFYITVRNTDQFNNVSVGDILVRINDAPVSSADISWENGETQIAANKGILTATMADTGSTVPTVTDGDVHKVKIIGPSGRPQETSASC